MKNLKLSTRLGLGFSLVLLILLVLGGAAILQMNAVKQESTLLAEAYVPEVQVGSAIERSFRRAFMDFRGYSLSGSEVYYQGGMDALQDTEENIQQAKLLLAQQSLPELESATAILEDMLATYREQVGETREIVNAAAASTGTLNEAATVLMRESGDFLAGQKAKLGRDLDLRQRKVRLASEIVQVVTQARVTNFRAQADQDVRMMEAAERILDQVPEKVTLLREITFLAEDIAYLNELEEAARSYQSAINHYAMETQKGDAVDLAKLATATAQMDATAPILVATVDAFLLGQQAKLKTDFSERLDKIEEVNRVVTEVSEVRVANFKGQAFRDATLIADAMTRFSTIDTALAALRPITRDPEDIARLDATRSATDSYREALSAYLLLDERLNKLNGIRNVHYKKIIAEIEHVSNLGLKHSSALSQKAVARLAQASWVIIIGVVAAVLMGIGCACWITQTTGNSIRSIIRGLTDASDQVATGSSEVSRSSQQLAEGASQQAAGVEETSSSLEELAAMTRQNAENAESANTTMSATTEVVEEANGAMSDLITSMQAIAESSTETQKIIKTIDEIAFQTNLLALNAAVEAARAGEAGAGFAVVADEVRNLAIRAADAAKSTADLIEGSVSRICTGTEIVNRTHDAFSRVSSGATQVSGLVSEISTASREQSNGIEQINRAVSEMDKVVQQNASGAQQSAAAAQQMSAQAVTMRGCVDQLIRLVEGGNGAGPTALAGTHTVPPASRSPLSTSVDATHGRATVLPSLGGHSNGNGSRVEESDLTFFDQKN